jgi:hypothetical protein
MPSFPSVLYPLAADWQEEIILPVYTYFTRQSATTVRWGSHGKWRGYGTFELYDRTAQDAWFRFLGEINFGEGMFSMKTLYPHAKSVSLPTIYGTLSEFLFGTIVSLPANWWAGVENLLKYSEDLSQTSVWQAVGGATVTRTSGRPDPLGGSTAWRMQTSGGSYYEKLVQIRADIPTTPTSKWGISCWVKNNGTNTVRVGVRYSGNAGTYVDVPSGSGWVEIRAAGSPTVNYYLGIEFRSLNTSDSLDFDVWHPAAAMYKAPGVVVTAPSDMIDVSYVATDASDRPINPDGRVYLTRYATAASSGTVAGRLFLPNCILVTQGGQESANKLQYQFLAPIDKASVVGMIIMEV